MTTSSASAKIAIPLVRFGEAVGPLLQHKTGFVANNNELLADQQRLATLYKSQPPGTTCMTCGAPKWVSHTEKSLQYLCDEFDFDRCAEWWFGLDVADLYRAFYVTYSAIVTERIGGHAQ